jgi:hypothetical protein
MGVARTVAGLSQSMSAFTALVPSLRRRPQVTLVVPEPVAEHEPD